MQRSGRGGGVHSGFHRNDNQALETVKAHHPDLVLMDIAMKALNGLDAMARIKREFPQEKP